MDQNQIIVIDNGTASIKVGYSGENMPRVKQIIQNCIDSVYGKVKALNE